MDGKKMRVSASYNRLQLPGSAALSAWQGDARSASSHRQPRTHGLTSTSAGGRVAEPHAQELPNTSIIVRPKVSSQLRSLLGRTIAGRYVLRDILDHGVIGIVFDAEDLLGRRPVALTLMSSDITARPEALRRFREDVQIASRLEHPNVARIVDAAESKHGFYIAVERIRGISLRDWLDAKTQLPSLAEVRNITDQLLAGLEALHRQGVMHREIRPENIFVCDGGGGREVVKILSCGIAYYKEYQGGTARPSLINLLCGMPAYMGVDHCRARQVSPANDLHAVGRVLTELLQKRAPFSPQSSSHMLLRRMNSMPSPLVRAPSAEPVPARLEAFRLSLLTGDDGKLPRDAAEAREQLQRAFEEPSRPDGATSGAQALPARAAQGAGGAPSITAPGKRVGIIRPRSHESGVNDACLATLSAQGIATAICSDGVGILESVPPVVVLDCASEIDSACRWLDWLTGLPASIHVIVCMSSRIAGAFRQLLLRGAEDVMMYPIVPDALVERIRRAQQMKSM